MPEYEKKKNLTGTYILIVRSQEKKEINVGKLGAFIFQKGFYLYIGSAFGPGGLNARIRRHLCHDKKNHWHIDYLTLGKTITDVWFSCHSVKHECAWANSFYGVPELKSPITGFGSSDCSCPSHLFYSRKKPLIAYYRNILGDNLTRWHIGQRF